MVNHFSYTVNGKDFGKTNFVLVPAERHIYRNIIIFVLKLQRSEIFIKLALASATPLELNTFFDLFSIKIALASARSAGLQYIFQNPSRS